MYYVLIYFDNVHSSEFKWSSQLEMKFELKIILRTVFPRNTKNKKRLFIFFREILNQFKKWTIVTFCICNIHEPIVKLAESIIIMIFRFELQSWWRHSLHRRCWQWKTTTDYRGNQITNCASSKTTKIHKWQWFFSRFNCSTNNRMYIIGEYLYLLDKYG